MLFVGITGGVGAGKSEVLSVLNQRTDAKVLLADEVAHLLMKKGMPAYEQIIETFQGADLLEESGEFDRKKLADFIFGDERKRLQLNAIVHPAVKEYVIEDVKKARNENILQFYFFEAALILEEHYDAICDEIWYIYTREDIRRNRLKESRGYSDEKITNILSSQKSEAEFLAVCNEKIDNNGSREELVAQIEKLLRRKIHE